MNSRRRKRRAYSEVFHGLDVALGSFGGVLVRVVELCCLEESRAGNQFVRSSNRTKRTHLAALLLPPLLDTERTMRVSILVPHTASIMAKCSRLSWVWNSATPVYNSTKIHPSENASQGNDQPRPKRKLSDR